MESPSGEECEQQGPKVGETPVFFLAHFRVFKIWICLAAGQGRHILGIQGGTLRTRGKDSTIDWAVGSAISLFLRPLPKRGLPCGVPASPGAEGRVEVKGKFWELGGVHRAPLQCSLLLHPSTAGLSRGHSRQLALDLPASRGPEPHPGRQSEQQKTGGLSSQAEQEGLKQSSPRPQPSLGQPLLLKPRLLNTTSAGRASDVFWPHQSPRACP